MDVESRITVGLLAPLSLFCLVLVAIACGKTSGPLKDACTNAADSAIIGNLGNDLGGAAQTCGFSCIAASDLAACATPCIQNATSLSEGCSTCYGEMTRCSAVLCMMPCSSGTIYETCRNCLEMQGCNASFNECSGI